MVNQNEQARGTHFLEGTKGGTSQREKQAREVTHPLQSTERRTIKDSKRNH
jgi:hypothetical protein